MVDRRDNEGVSRRFGCVNFFRPIPGVASFCTVVGLVGALPMGVRAGAPEEAAPAGSAVAPAPEKIVAPVVELKTSMGSITVQLDPAKAPVTVANFLHYVASGHYDDTVFHRVVGGYMIQGGGFEKKGDQLAEKPTGAPIKNEADNGLRNLQGTIAMARTDVPDTATAQFFINCQDNEMLDHSPSAAGYAVFGRVTKGLEVVTQINAVKTGVREVMGRLANGQLRPMPLKSVPLSDVVIESVRIVTKAGEPAATDDKAVAAPADSRSSEPKAPGSK
jgi:cyclophilin family peptidyl-prolyl cis-trans isomerase